MNLPNLPTDNLYKFMALSGLTLIVLGMTLPNYLIKEINKETNKIRLELVEIDFEIQSYFEKDSLLEIELTELSEELNNYCYDKDSLDIIIDIDKVKESVMDSNYRDYFEFLIKYKNHLLPILARSDEFKRKSNEKKELQNSINKKIAIVNFKKKILAEEGKAVNKFRVLLIILGGIGGGLTYKGFKLWYSKVQIHLDKELLNKSSGNNIEE